jgi:nucleoside-diphosphate-sugar epimerase
MNKILVIGNMGYVGPSAIRQLKITYPEAKLIGLDIGYFAHSLTSVEGDNARIPETLLDKQLFYDVRKIDEAYLESNSLTDVDAIVYLAAISNDVMGELNPELTIDINCSSAVKLAKLLPNANFVFASSCSVYGAGSDKPRTELDGTNPLTAYAKSKVQAENELGKLTRTGKTTCLRYSTACGFTNRTRLDLMLNDFVASAITTGKIVVLSDGSPWRPLIHIEDMGKAAAFAINREKGEQFEIINIGSNDWNYQVRDYASFCGKLLDGLDVSINTDANPDKRSYQVDFTKFNELADEKFTPKVSVDNAVKELNNGLKNVPDLTSEFRTSPYMRIVTLKKHIDEGRLTNNLEWI